MSLQVAILKVLSSYPGGCATLAALKADLAILAASGAEWPQRMKRLAARAPGLDIFSQGLVVRDDGHWQISPAGMDLLRTIEARAQDSAPETDVASRAMLAERPRPPFLIVGRGDRRRRRRRPLVLDRTA